jgi:hypothetical protein
MARKTLKERLMRAKTRGKAIAIIAEWKESYGSQFAALVREMDRAKSRGDLRTIGYCIGQLDGIQKKLLHGVDVIAKYIIQPDLPALDPDDSSPLWEDESP